MAHESTQSTEKDTTQNVEQTQVETTAQEQQALENFEWDTDGTGDFFGITGTGVSSEEEEVQKVVEEIKSEAGEQTPTATEKIETEEKLSDEEFFGIGTEETTDAKTQTQKEETNVEDDYQSLTTKMKENGIFQNIEIPEEEEITEEKFFEYQDQEVEARVDEAFEGFFSELDEDAAAFLKFKKDGGKTEDFFKTYSRPTVVPQGDLEDESYQEKLTRYYYSQIEGDDSEDVEDKIEWLKDSGKLKKFAEKFDQKIKDSDQKAKENLAEAQKQASKDAEDAKKAFASSVQKALQDTDKVDNFIFTPKSKKSLLPFITRQSVKVGKNTYITPMQQKLSTALRDPEKMLVLAQLLQNDFDVSGIVESANTEATKNLKKNLQRQKTGVKPSGSGKIEKKRSLSDFF